MLRQELRNSAERLLRVLDETGVFEFFNAPMRQEQERRDVTHSLQVFRDFAEASAEFTATDRHLMEVFGLVDLHETSFWFRAISKATDVPVREMSTRLRNMRKFLPRVIQMLTSEADRTRSEISSGKEPSFDVLSITFVEDRGQVSRPVRIIDGLKAVNQMYDVCAEMSGAAPDTLYVVGCDSGSDKTFDFLGLAQVMGAVKDLILDLWDRAVFYRQTQNEANLNAALKNLRLIDEISRLEGDEKLDHEQAERLKHFAVNAAGTFLSAGILTPEIAARTTHNPRTLLAPQPKLLGGSILPMEEPPHPAAAPPAPQPALPTEPRRRASSQRRQELSRDERRQLRELMERDRAARAASDAHEDEHEEDI